MAEKNRILLQVWQFVITARGFDYLQLNVFYPLFGLVQSFFSSFFFRSALLAFILVNFFLQQSYVKPCDYVCCRDRGRSIGETHIHERNEISASCAMSHRSLQTEQPSCFNVLRFLKVFIHLISNPQKLLKRSNRVKCDKVASFAGEPASYPAPPYVG